MTVEQLAEALKPVIEDVVRKVVQSEIREILTEAVEIASRPDGGADSFEIEETQTPVTHKSFPKPDWVQELDEKEQSKNSKSPVQESKRPDRIGSGMTQKEYEHQQAAILSLLQTTANSMTAEDASNFK